MGLYGGDSVRRVYSRRVRRKQYPEGVQQECTAGVQYHIQCTAGLYGRCTVQYGQCTAGLYGQVQYRTVYGRSVRPGVLYTLGPLGLYGQECYIP